jgi:hypothetical protein
MFVEWMLVERPNDFRMTSAYPPISSVHGDAEHGESGPTGDMTADEPVSGNVASRRCIYLGIVAIASPGPSGVKLPIGRQPRLLEMAQFACPIGRCDLGRHG